MYTYIYIYIYIYVYRERKRDITCCWTAPGADASHVGPGGPDAPRDRTGSPIGGPGRWALTEPSEEPAKLGAGSSEPAETWRTTDRWLATGLLSGLLSGLLACCPRRASRNRVGDAEGDIATRTGAGPATRDDPVAERTTITGPGKEGASPFGCAAGSSNGRSPGRTADGEKLRARDIASGAASGADSGGVASGLRGDAAAEAPLDRDWRRTASGVGQPSPAGVREAGIEAEADLTTTDEDEPVAVGGAPATLTRSAGNAPDGDLSTDAEARIPAGTTTVRAGGRPPTLPPAPDPRLLYHFVSYYVILYYIMVYDFIS